MKRSSASFLALIFVLVVAIWIPFHFRGAGKEDIAAMTKGDNAVRQYSSPKYGFSFSYPANARLFEKIFDDDVNPDSWSIIRERAGKPEPQPVDCGLTYDDELYMLIGIADLKNDQPNMKSYAEAISRRYDDEKHVTVEQGGKKFKVEEHIPGMCREGTEVLWKDPSGRYIVLFSYPTETVREQDYWDIIQSFSFR